MASSADEQSERYAARRAAFRARHAFTCEEAEMRPEQLRHCREIDMSGRKLSAAALGFQFAPHVVEFRRKGLDAEMKWKKEYDAGDQAARRDVAFAIAKAELENDRRHAVELGLVAAKTISSGSVLQRRRPQTWGEMSVQVELSNNE